MTRVALYKYCVFRSLRENRTLLFFCVSFECTLLLVACAYMFGASYFVHKHLCMVAQRGLSETPAFYLFVTFLILSSSHDVDGSCDARLSIVAGGCGPSPLPCRQREVFAAFQYCTFGTTSNCRAGHEHFDRHASAVGAASLAWCEDGRNAGRDATYDAGGEPLDRRWKASSGACSIARRSAGSFAAPRDGLMECGVGQESGVGEIRPNAWPGSPSACRAHRAVEWREDGDATDRASPTAAHPSKRC